MRVGGSGRLPEQGGRRLCVRWWGPSSFCVSRGEGGGRESCVGFRAGCPSLAAAGIWRRPYSDFFLSFPFFPFPLRAHSWGRKAPSPLIMGVQLGEEEDKGGTLAIAPRWPWLGLERADSSLERAGRGLLVWSSLGTPLRLGCGERTNQEEVKGKGKGKEGGIQFSSLSSLSLSSPSSLSPTSVGPLSAQKGRQIFSPSSPSPDLRCESLHSTEGTRIQQVLS